MLHTFQFFFRFIHGIDIVEMAEGGISQQNACIAFNRERGESGGVGLVALHTQL
jgi:hypothetical protein